MSLSLIWAQSADGVIGVAGALPWHLPEDLAHFRDLTAGSVVLMGHTTWLSLPERFRPLPARTNLVLSRRHGLALDGAVVVGGVAEALEAVAGREAWVIGGSQVYAAFLDLADRAEVTEIDVVVGPGTPGPVLDASWAMETAVPPSGWSRSSTGLRYRFVTHRRRGHRGQSGDGQR
jgi:dihydrofolate reductase